jgi:glycosyltransferase involved in cell wall biosynthesis
VNTAPWLSIGLPVCNGEKYLGESLEVLLGQTYEDFELILSDNASIDGTADICRQYQRHDSRIRYLRQGENIGSVENHNFVFREACGELFKWAAEDLYARDLLVRCVALLDEHSGAVLAHLYSCCCSWWPSRPTPGDTTPPTVAITSLANNAQAGDIGGQYTVMVRFDKSVAYADVRILEHSGLDQTNPFDVSRSATGSTAQANSGAATTNFARELIVGGGVTSGRFSGAGPGFTARIITDPDCDVAEDRTVTTTGSYSATAPQSGNWVMPMATFKGTGQ